MCAFVPMYVRKSEYVGLLSLACLHEWSDMRLWNGVARSLLATLAADVGFLCFLTCRSCRCGRPVPIQFSMLIIMNVSCHSYRPQALGIDTVACKAAQSRT